MPEVGDFTSDGDHIYLEARDANDVIIPGKTRRVKTNARQRELYNVRKGGFHPLSGQLIFKPDADPYFNSMWQVGDYGIIEAILNTTTELEKQPAYWVQLLDILDSAALQGIIRLKATTYNEDGTVKERGFTPGALNEHVFIIREKSVDGEGNPLTDPANDQLWFSCFYDLTGDFAGRFTFALNPRVDEFVYEASSMNDPSKATPLDTSTVAEVPKVAHRYFHAQGFIAGVGSSYLQRVSWRKVAAGYEIRVMFWPGWSGNDITLAFRPAAFAEGTNPTFTKNPNDPEVFDLFPDDTLVGGRAITQILTASEEPRSKTLGTVDDAVKDSKDPVTSGAVWRLKDYLAGQLSVLDTNKQNVDIALASLRRNDLILTTWLESLTSDGPGFYAKVSDVPTTEDVAVVTVNGVDTIHVRNKAGDLKTLASFADGVEATEAYNKAIAFVAGLKAAAGSSVDPAELAAIKADVDKVESDLLTISKTAFGTVAEVANYVVPNPIWPAGLSNAVGGSLMVRRGQVTTVKTTLVNNISFTNSHVIAQTFTTAERGKSIIARAAVKADDTNNRIELAAQTFPDGGSMGNATLSYVNGAWTATGGTVTLDEGWAVLSFPVAFSANANSQIIGGISPGDVQLLAIYDAASAAYSKTATDLDVTDTKTGTKVRIPLDLKTQLSGIDSNRATIASNAARIAAVEAKVDATTPVTTPGGVTRSDSTPFINIPDRAGVRFDKLKFTFADSRKNSAGGFEYPSRTTVLEVPATWLDMGAVTGRTGWVASAQTFDDPTSTTTPKATITRNSLFRTLSYGSANVRADYDIWLNFRRNADSWDIWFQGQHITTDRKPMNQYCGVYDISATYVVDTSAVDPKLKPIVDRVTALEAKPAPDLTGLATTTQLAAEITRAKKAEGDNTLAIATNSSSIGVVSSSLSDEVARAKAAETALASRVKVVEDRTAPASVDLTPYAKKKDLAKKQGRVKLWSPEAADFAVTLGAIQEDTAPAFAPSADIDAKVFTVVPGAPGVRAATVRFTVPNLVIGQRYELAVEVGSGLVTGFTLAGPAATTQDVTNWKKYSQIITATATTYAGSYTVTHGAVVHGPAVYALPGLYVQDEALAAYQVAEPADVAAAEARANSVTNFLAQTVQGQGSRISALEARPTGTSPPNPQWFPAERDYGKAYLRRTASGNQAQSISFDFMAAGSGNVPVAVNLPTAGAPISGWPISGFWGVPALFINITPPGGSAMTIYVGASIDGVVEIGVGPASGNASLAIGRVRNVIIDGAVADRIT